MSARWPSAPSACPASWARPPRASCRPAACQKLVSERSVGVGHRPSTGKASKDGEHPLAGWREQPAAEIRARPQWASCGRMLSVVRKSGDMDAPVWSPVQG